MWCQSCVIGETTVNCQIDFAAVSIRLTKHIETRKEHITFAELSCKIDATIDTYEYAKLGMFVNHLANQVVVTHGVPPIKML